MRRSLLPLLASVSALVGLTATAAPAVAGTPVVASDNVTLQYKLPEAVGAISSRFSPDGKLMYTSTATGLLIHDISNPSMPVLKGALPLPHFENEDVDVGPGIVVLTNDPSFTEAGVMYIIDVSNPALPTVASVTPTYTPTGSLGAAETGNGHILNCIQNCDYVWSTGTEEGITVYDIRDRTKPKYLGKFQMPSVKRGTATKATPGFTHDVFVDKAGIAWITGEDGTFGYDATGDPLHPKLRYRSDEAIKNTGGGLPGDDGSSPLDFLHHNSIRTDLQLGSRYVAQNAGDPATALGGTPGATTTTTTTTTTPPPTTGTPGETPPATTGETPSGGTQTTPATTPPSGGTTPGGTSGGGTSGGTTPGGSTPSGGGTGQPPASSKPAKVKVVYTALERKALAKCAKKKSKAKRTACAKPIKAKALKRAQRKAAAAGGKAKARTTLGGLGDVMAVTEEDYLHPGCEGQGSVQTWQITQSDKNSDGSAKLKLLDFWTTELNELVGLDGRSPATVNCSAHWFDESNGLLAQGWYDQGVRFMDITTPGDIKQVGYYISAGTYWGAYYAPTDPTRQTVYALDVAGGIDVLHIDRKTSGKALEAPITQRMRTGSGTTLPSKTFGFACPLLAKISFT